MRRRRTVRPPNVEVSLEYLVYSGDVLVGRATLAWTEPPALPDWAAQVRTAMPRFWSGPFVPTDAYYGEIEARCQVAFGRTGEGMLEYQARQDALALSLRTPDGIEVPTHFVRIQDATAEIRAIHPPDAERPEARQLLAMPAELDAEGRIVPLRPGGKDQVERP